MIDSLSVAELGHFSLVLALSLTLIQSTVPLIGLHWGDGRLVEVARTSANGGVRLHRHRLRGAHGRLRALRFFGGERLGEQPLGQAAALQGHRRLGQPRRLDAALGADPGTVQRNAGAFRHTAGRAARAGARRPGVDRVGVSSSSSC
jgi:hypothetical protein